MNVKELKAALEPLDDSLIVTVKELKAALEPLDDSLPVQTAWCEGTTLNVRFINYTCSRCADREHWLRAFD